MRVKLQALATLVCIVGILFGAACKMWFPEYWFDWYPIIIASFWFMEMVLSFVLERCQDEAQQASANSNKFLKVLMISKIVKMFIAIALVAVYMNIANDHVEEFAGCTVAFYLLNLAVETYAVTKKKK